MHKILVTSWCGFNDDISVLKIIIPSNKQFLKCFELVKTMNNVNIVI